MANKTSPRPTVVDTGVVAEVPQLQPDQFAEILYRLGARLDALRWEGQFNVFAERPQK